MADGTEKRRLSGAQNRKAKKKKQLEDAAASTMSIRGFFKSHDEVSAVPGASVHDNSKDTDASVESDRVQLQQCSDADTTAIIVQEGNSMTNDRVAGSPVSAVPGASVDGNSKDTDTSVESDRVQQCTDADTAQDCKDISDAEDSSNVNANAQSPLTDDSHFFTRPSPSSLEEYFKFHPNQPLSNLPFKGKLAFFKPGGDNICRKWLSYSNSQDALFCSMCVAFSSEKSAFISGANDWRHIYARIQQHERCQMHADSVESYIMHVSASNLLGKSFISSSSQRRKEVAERRMILLRIIETIIVLGRQSLGLRGHRNEAAYNILDDTVNGGNFIEILKLISKFDTVLHAHLVKVAQESEKIRLRMDKRKKAKYGRGGFVTFISKTTIQTILNAIKLLMHKEIANEVMKADIYSVQMDTTQDLMAQDQCTIVLRYVLQDCVRERLSVW